MNLKFDMNTAELRMAARTAVRDLRANGDLLIKEEGRLWHGEWTRRTPPFSKGYGQAPSAGKDRKAGERAVSGDLSRVATKIDKTKNWSPELQEVLGIKKKFRFEGVENWLKMTKLDWLRGRALITVDRFKQLHKSSRNRRGRIPRDLRNAVIVDSDLKRYIRTQVKKVGYAKATLNRAAAALGARLPAYVARHGPLGAYREGRAPNFFIEISGKSNVPGAQAAANQASEIRGKKLTAEIKRLMNAFARTGKIESRRKSFNQSAE
jgi:hypothetical protein